MAEGTSENITETIYDPGNVTIHACHLKHGDEVINLVGGLDEFIVTYSTLNNSASCKATILDTQDILADIDIDGSETIKLSWNSLDDDVITDEFAVYRKETIVDKSQGGKGKVYVLHGFDITNLKQMILDVNRSFTGQISEHVKTIFKEIGSEKEIEIHDTVGTSSLIIPGETPFEAINRLCTFAFSSGHSSSLYQFYQSKKGYNFKNIERVIAEQRDTPHTYRYAPSALAEQSKTMLGKHSIIEIDFPIKKSLIEKLKHGSCASSVAEIDIINQKIDVTNFNITENFDKFYHLDQPAITSDKKKIIEDSLSVINNTTWINKYFDGQRHLDFSFGPQLTRREYYGNALDQNEMVCTIHGNSSIDCGEVLYLSMLERSGRTETPEQEKIISGNYLITSVTHIIKQNRYACNLICNKESGRANVTDLDNYIIGDK